MAKRIRTLLQCSSSFSSDDWHVGRFSLLTRELERWSDVTARNREPDEHDRDPFIVGLDRAQFDQVWLLAVDGGVALGNDETGAINRFQRDGGGVLTARDHANMGLWLRAIERVGPANFFNELPYREPDPTRHSRDDEQTASIDWPNYHSGNNGDVQPITIVEPVHPVMINPTGPTGRISWFPAHPHEGAVCVPSSDPSARSVARGRSLVTKRVFDLAITFDRTATTSSRAIAQSSFHHFADYNWDTSKGAPSFVIEPVGDAIDRDPRLLDDIRAYVKNCVEWLGPESS
jgi:hypothetical protein